MKQYAISLCLLFVFFFSSTAFAFDILFFNSTQSKVRIKITWKKQDDFYLPYDTVYGEVDRIGTDNQDNESKFNVASGSVIVISSFDLKAASLKICRVRFMEAQKGMKGKQYYSVALGKNAKNVGVLIHVKDGGLYGLDIQKEFFGADLQSMRIVDIPQDNITMKNYIATLCLLKKKYVKKDAYERKDAMTIREMSEFQQKFYTLGKHKKKIFPQLDVFEENLESVSTSISRAQKENVDFLRIFDSDAKKLEKKDGLFNTV